jgi:hypothetical protein
MKLSQILEMWKKFLSEEREKVCNEEEILDEEEDFQKTVKQGYVKDRNEYLETGPQDPGPAFPKKTKKTRALSAPGPYAGA